MATLAQHRRTSRKRKTRHNPLAGPLLLLGRRGAGRRALYRLCAVAALAGRAGDARCAVAADRGRGREFQHRAGGDPPRHPAPPGHARTASTSPICGPRSRRPTRRRSRASARPADPNRRLFVTIAAGDTTLPIMSRVKEIYPRYLVAEPAAGPPGLTLRGFRDGTPYQGEELVFEQADARAFPGALHAQRRGQFRQLPAGAAHRQCRHHLPLSARLAEGLEERGRRRRQTAGAAASRFLVIPGRERQRAAPEIQETRYPDL